MKTTELRTAAEIAVSDYASLIPTSELSDPAARTTLARELFAEGLFDSETDALRYVMWLAKDAAGEPLAPDLRTAMIATRDMIEHRRRARALMAAAEEQQTQMDRTLAMRDRLENDLRDVRHRMASSTVSEAIAVENYIANIISQRKPWHVSLEFFRSLLAEREQERFLREAVTPELERRLAAANQEIEKLRAA